MAGAEFGPPRASLQSFHKDRLVLQAQALFDEFADQVGDSGSLSSSGTATLPKDKRLLSLFMKGEVISGVSMTTDEEINELRHSERTVIRFFDSKNPPIKVTKSVGDTKIGLHYSEIDDDGNASCVDGGIITYSRGIGKGESLYYPSIRRLKFVSGVPLFVQQEDKSNLLIVRDEDDPTLKGIALPLQFNIYERLKHIESLIRNVGKNGK